MERPALPCARCMNPNSPWLSEGAWTPKLGRDMFEAGRDMSCVRCIHSFSLFVPIFAFFSAFGGGRSHLLRLAEKP